MENELSRPCNLQKIGKKQDIEIRADETERANLANRFSILDISRLVAHCRVHKMKNNEVGDYLLEVKMLAQIRQRCVMTLDNVEETINEEFSVIFKEVDDLNGLEGGGIDIEFEMDQDDIEFISTPDVDLGKYVAEYLSLSINPYPKKTGYEKSTLGYEILDEKQISAEPKKENPFKVLKDLKHKT